MPFVLNYKQSVYNRQISLLQSHLDRLQGCYDELERLKENMFTFWDDENAQTSAYLLQNTLFRVRNEMNRANKILAYYTSTVEYVSGANDAISDLAEDAFGALEKLGGLM